MFDNNLSIYFSGSLINLFKRKYNISINTSAGSCSYGCHSIDISEHIEYRTSSIYINGREKENLHIEITGINLAKGKSLKNSLIYSIVYLVAERLYEEGGIFLLNLCSNKEQKNPYGSLIKFNSTCHNKNNQDKELILSAFIIH